MPFPSMYMAVLPPPSRFMASVHPSHLKMLVNSAREKPWDMLLRPSTVIRYNLLPAKPTPVLGCLFLLKALSARLTVLLFSRRRGPANITLGSAVAATESEVIMVFFL